MKNLVFIFLLASFAFAGCNQEKVKQLEEENAKLSQAVERQDSVLNDFLESFNAIEDNLAIIREKENLIALSSGDPELQEDQKGRIVNDISLINNLLDENKKIIEDLNKKLSRSNVRASEFKRMVSRLEGQVAQRDSSITSLKQQLSSKDFAIGELNQKLDSFQVASVQQTARMADQAQLLEEANEEIESKTEALNTAFYVVGNSKELIAMEVLDKGGLFGKKEISTDFGKEKFTPIDLTEVFTIPVNSKKAEIMSSHPEGSYILNGDNSEVKSIEITDPDKFWRNSKYLVVMTK